MNKIFQKLDNYKRDYLVAGDPEVCAVIFYMIVTVLISTLCAKRKYNPFGPYCAVHYFMRIELHHPGSSHAHALLWLENAPVEDLSEDMPLMLQVVTDQCSVDERDLVDPQMIRNRAHAHTFTCTKQSEQHRRFNIPHWPMYQSRILKPLSEEDESRTYLKKHRLRPRATGIKSVWRMILSKHDFSTVACLSPPQY